MQGDFSKKHWVVAALNVNYHYQKKVKINSKWILFD